MKARKETRNSIKKVNTKKVKQTQNKSERKKTR